jgi:cytochrome P450
MATNARGADALNPFPWYAQMREAAPVVFRNGAWHVFGYADVQRVLSDYEHFSSQRGGGGDPLSASIISIDPPRHRQLRALATLAFTPRTVAQLEPRITAITNDLLDRVAATGTMDAITDLAVPLPVIVIAEMLGIPATDRERFKLWSDAIVQGTHSEAEANTSTTLGPHWHQEMIGYFQAMLAERRRAPQDDLISALLAARVEGEQLTDQELIGFCVLLLIAGNETTTNLIGNALLCFDEQPAIAEQLRQQPDRLPDTIEEVLRYRSPVQSMFRVTKEAVVLSGQTIPADEWVVAWIGSANRDPAQFPAPERFDLTRTPNRHLAFGYGIHFCLGAPLARLESRIVLHTLLTRFRTLQRVPGVALTPLSGNIVFGVRNLPITFAQG